VMTRFCCICSAKHLRKIFLLFGSNWYCHQICYALAVCKAPSYTP
jgi:hypothetical protein